MSILENLLAAVKELNETLQATLEVARGGAAQESPAETPAKTKRTRGTKKAAPPTDDDVTLDDVRAALKVLVDANDNATVKKLLKKYGGAKLSDVAESDYAALKADAEEAAGGGEGEDDDLL